jgi:hypothetical protein
MRSISHLCSNFDKRCLSILWALTARARCECVRFGGLPVLVGDRVHHNVALLILCFPGTTGPSLRGVRGCGCGTAPRQFMRPGNDLRSPGRVSYDDEDSNGSGSVARAAAGGQGVRKRSQGRARISSTTLWWTARSTSRGSPPNRGRSHRQRVGEAADKACQTCGRDAKGER